MSSGYSKCVFLCAPSLFLSAGGDYAQDESICAAQRRRYVSCWPQAAFFAFTLDYFLWLPGWLSYWLCFFLLFPFSFSSSSLLLLSLAIANYYYFFSCSEQGENFRRPHSLSEQRFHAQFNLPSAGHPWASWFHFLVLQRKGKCACLLV